MKMKLIQLPLFLILFLLPGIAISQTFGSFQILENKNGTFDLRTADGKTSLVAGCQEIKPIAFQYLLYDVLDERILLCTKANKKELFDVSSGQIIFSQKTETIDFTLPTREDLQFHNSNRIPLLQPDWIIVYTDKQVQLLNCVKRKIVFQSEYNGMEIFETHSKTRFRTAVKNYASTIIDENGNTLLDQCASLEENADGTFIIERNYLFGIADPLGKILVEPKYTRITNSERSHHFVLAEDTLNKAGVITTHGEVRIPFEYDINDYSDFEWAERVNSCQNDIFFLHKNKNMWIVDSTNKLLTDVPLTRQDRRFEHPEYVKVFKDELEGIFNTRTGKLVVNPIYKLDFIKEEDDILKKHHALGAVKDGKWGLLNLEDGSTLIPFEYQPDVHNFTGHKLEDYDKSISRNFNQFQDFVVKKNGLFGIVDIQHHVLLPFEFEKIVRTCPKQVEYKLIILKKNGLFGIYDSNTFQEIFPAIYNEVNCDLRLKKTTNGIEEVFYIQNDRTLKPAKT